MLMVAWNVAAGVEQRAEGGEDRYIDTGYWRVYVVTSDGRCANIANVTRVKETVLVAAEHNGAVEHSEGGN